MNKKICKIIIIIMVILVIIVGIMYFIDLDRMSKGEKVVFSTWGTKYAPIEKNINKEVNDISPEQSKENTKVQVLGDASKTTDVEFVNTYNIVSNLEITDATGKYNFYVVQQFQLFEPIVIKVDKKYTLEEKANYEFTFKGNKIEGKEYTIQDIFNTFDIINIEKTDKLGLEQRQDEI